MEKYKTTVKARRTKPAEQDMIGQLGKLPPQAIELEEAVLGAMMIERNCVTAVLGILYPSDFYKFENSIIYEAIVVLFAANQPVDIKTVIHKLREMGQLDAAGGAYYVSNLTVKINSAANIDYHSRIVKEQSLKRSIITIATQAQHNAYEDTIDVFVLMEQMMESVFALNHGLDSRNFVNIGDPAILTKLIETIEEARQAKKNNQVIGVPCGFTAIDRLTGGFRNKDLIVIAARPAMGKTAFVATMMKNMAVDFDKPVGMFSLEMGWDQIGMRIISLTSEVDLEKLRNGSTETFEVETVIHKTTAIHQKKIYVDDSPGLTIMQMRTKARLLKQRFNISCLFVDYMQLASGGADNNRQQNREQEIAAISRGLKIIAKELDIPVIVLSQLNRSVENRGGDKRPQLSDLRESGAIEQDADMVMFLHRPEYYGFTQDENGKSLEGLAEVIIAKNRNGRVGKEKLRFIGKFTKWDDEDSEPAFALQY